MHYLDTWYLEEVKYHLFKGISYGYYSTFIIECVNSILSSPLIKMLTQSQFLSHFLEKVVFIVNLIYHNVAYLCVSFTIIF